MRVYLHYLFSAVILYVYGGEVCPFVSSLDKASWAISLFALYSVTFIVRPFLLRALLSGQPAVPQTERQFFLEFGIFLAMAVAIGFYNAIVLGFPAGSGLKVAVGFSVFGFFAGLDLALERERESFQKLTGEEIEVCLPEKIFPLTLQFALIAAVTVVFSTVVIFLIISRDLEWLVHLEPGAMDKAKMAVFVELVFCGGTLIAELLNVIYSFAKNLKLFFGHQNSTLMAVAQGKLNSRVTISTNNEFALMGYYTNQMIHDLRARTEELEETQNEVVRRLGLAAEYRDNETGLHVLRMSHFSALLGRRAGMSDEDVKLLLNASPMHDIGKIGTPDSILLKPGKLNPGEWEIMKNHATIGGKILSMGKSRLLKMSEEVALTHHEKWDGSGYPRGLKGKEIPLTGRITAICDVFDALTSARPYKDSWTVEGAMALIDREAGRQFDPDLVSLFREVLPDVLEARSRFQEEPVSA